MPENSIMDTARILFAMVHDTVSDLEHIALHPEIVTDVQRIKWPHDIRASVEAFHVELFGCGGPCGHKSDCSTHNAPAMPVKPCDCGAVAADGVIVTGGRS